MKRKENKGRKSKGSKGRKTKRIEYALESRVRRQSNAYLISADRIRESLNNLEPESNAIFDGSSVVVRTLVGGRLEELIDHCGPKGASADCPAD